MISEWQPIETAPRDGAFLVWAEGEVLMAEMGQSGKTILYWNDPAPHEIRGATHWRPLPQGPATLEAKQ